MGTVLQCLTGCNGFYFPIQLFSIIVKRVAASGETEKQENKKAALRREQLIVSFLIMRG